MKNNKLGIVIIIMTFIIITGCSEPELTYTIWTDTITYSEFTNSFGTTLNDGYYVRLEFTNAQWNQISPLLTSEGRYN